MLICSWPINGSMIGIDSDNESSPTDHSHSSSEKQFTTGIQTNNETSITECQSASTRLFAGKWHPLVSVIKTLLCRNYFSSSSVVLRPFSALCMYSKFRHHPHPLGYLCAKFHFFRGLRCWASRWRKTVDSITQLITHPASLMPWRRSFRFRKTIHY